MNDTEIFEVRKIDVLTFVMTSIACPEQYEVFDVNGKQVGYLRLRNGWFRVDYPDCGQETIYEAYPKGDGVFEEDEVDFYLNEAVKAIKLRMSSPL
jgi:hypothetical protein